ncbi:MAG: Integrase [uncultured Rubrobacteraceae bacterium]|uniref:Integrase n=1 Tax=uncultured Rubrobacteraceae bacterium TaxID=349277 RepID=A0A6J4PAL8_9ACTN|nr:MAG: Integrase [uncultured Rubrobacteraceae bacterium]
MAPISRAGRFVQQPTGYTAFVPALLPPDPPVDVDLAMVGLLSRELREYLSRWLEDSVKDTVRNTTYERYEQIARTHIIPMLGDVKLKGLSPTHVRGLYKEKLQTLSLRTVQYIHVTLHKALEQAVNDSLIPRNATEAVKPPQVRREEIRPLTPEQVKQLLDAARGDRLEALYVLAVHTGLRQGELLGLKWEDVDLESGSLPVKRTLTTARGGPRLAAPKTKGSRRRVSLTRGAVDALRAHLARQLDEIAGPAPRGKRTGSCSPPRPVIPSTGATSLHASTSRFSSVRTCRKRPASTTSGTRARHCCSRRTSTPRSSRRC